MDELQDGKKAQEQRQGLSRRSLLKSGAVLAGFHTLGYIGSRGASGSLPRQRVVVVGAGAFGGWTALHLLRQGARVILIDTWGPGNSRASSGGETRVIRGTYGPHPIYVEMVARSLELWSDNEARWKRRLYRRCGALWMAGKDDQYEKASLPLLKQAGLRHEEWSTTEAGKRFPQINFEGVNWVIYEHDAGYLLARRACEAVLEGFLVEGGEYRQLSAEPARPEHGRLGGLKLSDGSTLKADQYVFACGPWLAKLFPDVKEDLISPTRQEVFYFGTPAGNRQFLEEALPVWIDNGEHIFYGIPGSERRGFKVADDTRGVAFDPTWGERIPTSEGLVAARAYLEFRFPGLKGAPLLESRVCQYENSPDSHFLIDRHPRASNAWLVGGGSGHGFKHGPAVGERVAQAVLGKIRPDPFFGLSRFSS